MAKPIFPQWQERQRILHAQEKKIDVEKVIALGQEALRRDYVQDAFEYFVRANHVEGLQEVKSRAMDQGDAFLCMALERVGKSLNTNEWNKVGKRALELGKLKFAHSAFEKAHNEDMCNKVRANVEPGHDSSNL